MTNQKIPGAIVFLYYKKILKKYSKKIQYILTQLIPDANIAS